MALLSRPFARLHVPMMSFRRYGGIYQLHKTPSYRPITVNYMNKGAWSRLERIRVVAPKYLSMFARMVFLGILWFPALVFPVPMLFSRVFSNAIEDGCWNWVLWTVSQSGPMAIKLAQWASTRPDLFAESFCTRMSQFHTDSPAHSWYNSTLVLDANFPEWRTELWFKDVLPIGSGCIAQVYKAYHVSRQEFVAVKILHPDIEWHMSRDIALLRLLGSTLTWAGLAKESIDWNEGIRQFVEVLEAQFDLCREATNLKRFRSRTWKGVSFPEPILAFNQVLVETWAKDSVTLTEYLASESDPSTRKKIARNGLSAFLKMLFVDNFVHADLHFGNILVQGNELVFIDTGIVCELEETEKNDLRALFSAIVRHDGETAGALILDRSPANHCADREQFIQGISEIVSRTAPGLNLGKVKVGRLLMDVLAVCREHHVMLQSKFSSVVIAVVLLEGAGRALDPDLNLVKLAAQYLIK